MPGQTPRVSYCLASIFMSVVESRSTPTPDMWLTVKSEPVKLKFT